VVTSFSYFLFRFRVVGGGWGWDPDRSVDQFLCVAFYRAGESPGRASEFFRSWRGPVLMARMVETPAGAAPRMKKTRKHIRDVAFPRGLSVRRIWGGEMGGGGRPMWVGWGLVGSRLVSFSMGSLSLRRTHAFSFAVVTSACTEHIPTKQKKAGAFLLPH